MQIADGNMDPHIIVAAARFDQQDLRLRIATEAVGEHATCRARADDDVIVFAS
jgi:hypothetical protein